MAETKEIIEIVIEGKHAKSPSKHIVCDNSDYQIKFVFDDEWNDYPHKTVRFVWGGNKEDTVITGDTIDVPKITSPGLLKVGVYTDEVATTDAEIRCCPSILSKDGKPVPTTKDLYDQVIHLLNTLDADNVRAEVERAYEKIESLPKRSFISFLANVNSDGAGHYFSASDIEVTKHCPSFAYEVCCMRHFYGGGVFFKDCSGTGTYSIKTDLNDTGTVLSARITGNLGIDWVGDNGEIDITCQLTYLDNETYNSFLEDYVNHWETGVSEGFGYYTIYEMP